MEVNINNEALDNYGRFYSSLYDDEYPLVKAFKDKGFDEDVLHQVRLINVLVDSLIAQKQIFNGDDKS